MTDRDTKFDQFLAEALAPPERGPDQRFVARVEQRIRLEQLLQSQRARVVHRLGIEMLSLVALACAVAVLGGSSEIAAFVREVPHLALTAVMLVFVLWVAVLSGPDEPVLALNEYSS